jgi:hypothetical protein
MISHPQLDERAVGHHDDGLVWIADGSRIRRDLPRPAWPERNFRNASRGKRADLSTGCEPGSHA